MECVSHILKDGILTNRQKSARRSFGAVVGVMPIGSRQRRSAGLIAIRITDIMNSLQLLFSEFSIIKHGQSHSFIQIKILEEFQVFSEYTLSIL